MKNILKMFTAWYDPNTDTVINAKEGSLIWHHEMRHKEQFENKFMQKIFFIEILCLRVIGTIAVISAFLLDFENRGTWLILGGLALIPTAIISPLIEIDAWIFAFIRYASKSTTRKSKISSTHN